MITVEILTMACIGLSDTIYGHGVCMEERKRMIFEAYERIMRKLMTLIFSLLYMVESEKVKLNYTMSSYIYKIRTTHHIVNKVEWRICFVSTCGEKMV